MEISLEKFRTAVHQLKKDRIAQKGEVAAALGYNSVNTLTEILGGRSKLNLGIISKFCEVYGFNVEDFLVKKEINTENSVVSESMSEYKIDTIKTRAQEIESQFATIIKGQESLSTMLSSGLEFMNIQTSNIKILKKLVGA